jgi:UDP-glucose 4-epimerase
MQGMISIYLHQIMKNKKLIIKGSDKRVRDFIYIDDLTNFFMKIIGNKKFFNQTLNVGTGKKHTINEVIKKLRIITKINFPVIFKKSTPLDQFYIFPNIKKLKKFTNVKSFKSLDEGLNRLVFYLKNIYD